ncbi:BT_3044 domain-containing protein [Chitinophaga lutea]|nr:DUF4361 domain-containing protein [Chitinophaga lutea]
MQIIVKYCKTALLLLGVCAGIVSCDKEEGMNGAGQTIVSIPAVKDSMIIVGVDYKNSPQALNVLEVVRAPHNAAVLNGETSVKLSADPNLITKINASRHRTFIPLPANSYTLDPSVPFANGVYDLKFPSGEISKSIKININTGLLDLTKQYAMPFVMTEAVNGVVTSSKKVALVEVIIKNEWDGKYQASGTFFHPVNGPRAIDEEKLLQTIGPRTVLANLGDLGGSGYQMKITINADNSVTLVPAGATPNIDMSYGVNKYDPATKSFTLNYAYNTAAPRIVRETITRK